MKLPRLACFCLGLGLLLTNLGRAKEVPASQIVKVSHAEGGRYKTRSYDLSVAIVWRKGIKKQDFMLLVQHNQEPLHYFTISPNPPGTSRDITVGEGNGIKYTLDQKRQVFSIQSGAKTVEEKILQVIDS